MVPRNSSTRTLSRSIFGSPALKFEMTVPVKKADTIRVRLFSCTRRPRPHKRPNAGAYDLEPRFMLQFDTHFCMHQFLLFAILQ
jgi:hypothetical protein